jgi:hypothetical protein
MKKLFSILATLLFAVTPLISSWYYYYQSCSSLYGYGAIDAWNWYCKCMAWYTRYGNRCVSWYTYCQNVYGFNATYNSLSNSCQCRYGYWFYWWSCVSYNTLCQKLYGRSYHYNSLNGYCETYY